MAGGVKASGVNSFPVLKLSSLASVTSKQLPLGSEEEKEGTAQRESKMPPEAEPSKESNL